jgi:predicted AAA+ superfamily ATPase
LKAIEENFKARNAKVGNAKAPKTLRQRQPDGAVTSAESIVGAFGLVTQEKVFVARNEDRKVDFIAQETGDERVYYQVAYQVNDCLETLGSKLLPFKKGNYSKVFFDNEFGV